MTALTSIFVWVASASLILAWYPLMLVCSWFDRDPVRVRTGRLFRRVGLAITNLNPLWRVSVRGAKAVDPTRAYVVVSNHQSLADVPVLSHLPWEMKWMAKRELFSLPVIGSQLRLAGDIPVDRSNPRDAVKSLRRARSVLAQGCSVMVFPEGSRSRDGKVGPFLPGAFRLAIDAGVPVLPVVVNGTSNCLPKKSWRFGRARGIQVEVLPPIDTKGHSLRDSAELGERVRARIASRLEELQTEARARRDSGVKKRKAMVPLVTAQAAASEDALEVPT